MKMLEWLSLLVMVFLIISYINKSLLPHKAKSIHDILSAAKNSHSDALVIIKDGKKLVEWYADKKPEKIETMSITKSVVSLGISLLIAQRKLASIDVPVHEFYPEWNHGEKKSITIRHILTQTSGLEDKPDANIEIVPSKDIIRLALDSPLSTAPGTAFLYNNKASNLLSGIIQKACGKRMDLYLKENLFEPLGITDYVWQLDPSGTPYAMAGLSLLPTDLAKIGQLMLNHGKWQDKKIIDEQWIEQLFIPSQPYNPNYSLLWWLLRNPKDNTIDGINASGFMGQNLIIYPNKKLIGVRLIKYEHYNNNEKNKFEDFPLLVFALTR